MINNALVNLNEERYVGEEIQEVDDAPALAVELVLNLPTKPSKNEYTPKKDYFKIIMYAQQQELL